MAERDCESIAPTACPGTKVLCSSSNHTMKGNENRKVAKPDPSQPSFQLHYDQQAESRLLQLPAELRVKIFRSLLKSDKPLKPLRRVDPNGPQKSTHLSAQLLRSCRKVYTECLPVLYQENTLVIHYCPTRAGLKVLGVRPPYASSIHYYSDHGLPMHLLGYATRISTWPHYQFRPCDHIHAKYIMQIYPVLKRFRRFQVKIDLYAPQEAYFIMCRALQDLLFGKDVHVATLRSKADFTADMSRLALSACRYLRCRSIIFSGWKGSTTDLCNIITSTDAVNDTFPLYQELKRQVQHLPIGFHPSDYDFRLLASAAMSYDSERTQMEIRAMLMVCIERYSEWGTIEEGGRASEWDHYRCVPGPSNREANPCNQQWHNTKS